MQISLGCSARKIICALFTPELGKAQKKALFGGEPVFLLRHGAIGILRVAKSHQGNAQALIICDVGLPCQTSVEIHAGFGWKGAVLADDTCGSLFELFTI